MKKTARTIEVKGLTKRHGNRLALDNVSFTVQPGVVTGFVGPNGAGKSTAMRMILGLTKPTSGLATIGGRHYAELDRPLTEVGALLDARYLHSGRSARNHLLALAQSQGLGKKEVDRAIELVGLSDVAKLRTSTYSLGMCQRVGIASALLASPPVVILDEPLNGLDPEGIRWFRNLTLQLADEGRTVFISSHVMNEIARTAQQLIVIGRGKLLADCGTSEFMARHARAGDSLEDVFLRLTDNSTEYTGTTDHTETETL